MVALPAVTFSTPKALNEIPAFTVIEIVVVVVAPTVSVTVIVSRYEPMAVLYATLTIPSEPIVIPV